ncbi:MAG: Peptidyl-tRNA hydrolase [Chlamydiae bacterium]|nr:Peptidyl-tRNA hydrolase [Chlamydiota bacterium]
MGRLIVGLGNPGLAYARTRHNFGAMVLEAFAKKHGWAFKKESRFEAKMASGRFGEERIHLLFPLTYMNRSGVAVGKVAHYYKIPGDKLLVLVDDVDLPLGVIRIRPKGGTGGHNGLRSIEEHLGSQEYVRLRLGVGPKDGRDLRGKSEMALENYVLAKFAKDERAELPTIIDKGVDLIECWLTKGLEATSQTIGQ